MCFDFVVCYEIFEGIFWVNNYGCNYIVLFWIVFVFLFVDVEGLF